MAINRKQTRQIMVGNVPVGGGAPITVQSMTNTDTAKVDETVAQINRLEKAGCEIIRVAVPDQEAAAAIRQIREQIAIPLIADIHFDYRLAISSKDLFQQRARRLAALCNLCRQVSSLLSLLYSDPE